MTGSILRQEELIDQHRRLFEAVCNNATSAIIVMDDRQHCVYMNPAAERLTGYTLAETTGRLIHDIVHHTRPDGTHYPIEECPIDRAFPQNNQEQGEEIFVHKDGHFYPVAYTASPIRVEGVIVGTILELRDIAERRRAEAVLRAGEAATGRAIAELEAIYHAVPVGMAVLDRFLRYVRANETLARINGVPVDRHIGRTVREVVPDLADGVERIFRSVFESGEGVSDIEIEGETPGCPGEKRVWLETVAPLRDADGSVRWIIAAVLDITERRRAQDALRQSEERFRVSQELAPDAFTILRAERNQAGQVRDFIWEYANPAALRALRAENESLVGQRLLERLPGNREHPDLFPRYVRVLATGETSEVDLRYEADGVVGWFRNAVTRIDPDRLAVVFHDVTQRKLTEESIRSLLAEKERLAHHNELIAREMGHRIMNSFQLLQSLLRLEARDIKDPAAEKAIGGVLERIHAMAVLQRRLFESTRGNIGALDLGEYLKGLAGELVPAFIGQHCAFTVDAPAGIQVSTERASSLAMIATELVINACKHAFPNNRPGHLGVRLEPTEQGCRLIVGDDGVGLPDNFDPAASQGIGMRLLQGLVRQIEGMLEIDRSPPGTRFVIDFPV